MHAASSGATGDPSPDAGTDCPPLSGAAPTWSSIWATYGFSNSCHGCHKQASSAASAYSFLKQSGQINGPASLIAVAYNPLVVQNTSILTIFGGDMPLSGTAISPAAMCPIIDWVAAGATDN